MAAHHIHVHLHDAIAHKPSGPGGGQFTGEGSKSTVHKLESKGNPSVQSGYYYHHAGNARGPFATEEMAKQGEKEKRYPKAHEKPNDPEWKATRKAYLKTLK